MRVQFNKFGLKPLCTRGAERARAHANRHPRDDSCLILVSRAKLPDGLDGDGRSRTTKKSDESIRSSGRELGRYDRGREIENSELLCGYHSLPGRARCAVEEATTESRPYVPTDTAEKQAR